MPNYISSTITGGSVFIKGNVIHIERYGKKFKFPLKGSKNSISMSTADDEVVINGHSYDLNNLEQYVEPKVRKQRHKPESQGFFSRILHFILEVFD